MLTAFFWKKLWTWLKHYWYFPVIIILLVFVAFSGRTSRKKLFGLLEKQKENYEKELQIVKEAAEKASEEKSKAAEKYVEKLKMIEEEHDIKIDDLEKEKQKELKSTIEEKRNKPDELAKDIARILSAKYYEKNR